METIFINMENTKANEPDKLALTFSQGFNLKSLDKHVTIQN